MTEEKEPLKCNPNTCRRCGKMTFLASGICSDCWEYLTLGWPDPAEKKALKPEIVIVTTKATGD